VRVVSVEDASRVARYLSPSRNWHLTSSAVRKSANPNANSVRPVSADAWRWRSPNPPGISRRLSHRRAIWAKRPHDVFVLGLLRQRCAGAKAVHCVIDAARSRRLNDPRNRRRRRHGESWHTSAGRYGGAAMARLSVFGASRQQFGRTRVAIAPGRVIHHVGNRQLPLREQISRIHRTGQVVEKSGRIFRLRT